MWGLKSWGWTFGSRKFGFRIGSTPWIAIFGAKFGPKRSR